MQTIYFLGRLHVLALHLPLAILPLAILVEFLSRAPRFASLRPIRSYLWITGAATAIATVVLGLMHATEPAFLDSLAVKAHRLAGISFMLLACAVAAIRWRPTLLGNLHDKFALIAAGLVGVLTIVTGHLGGSLTHGETYLVDYAPEPIRRLAGVHDIKQRPKPGSVANADLYLDVVAPALKMRCGTCHNDRKRSGKLSFASYASLMAGGKKGAVIVTGAPDQSDLLRRISLPRDDEDFMPKEGKTPLTADEVDAVRAWIKHGAPQNSSASALELSAAETASVGRTLNLDGRAGQSLEGGGELPKGEPLPTVQPAAAQIVAALESSGFVIRPISRSSNFLDVDFDGSRKIAPDQLASLTQIAQQILHLNLRRAGLQDADLQSLSHMVNLRSLRLEGNPVGDAGMARLAALKELRYLNLYGTRISDAGLETLARLPHLREVYLWDTAVSTEGVETLRTKHPDLTAIAGTEGFDAVQTAKK